MLQWDAVSNYGMFVRFGVGGTVKRVDCGKVGWVKPGMYIEIV